MFSLFGISVKSRTWMFYWSKHVCVTECLHVWMKSVSLTFLDALGCLMMCLQAFWIIPNISEQGNTFREYLHFSFLSVSLLSFCTLLVRGSESQEKQKCDPRLWWFLAALVKNAFWTSCCFPLNCRWGLLKAAWTVHRLCKVLYICI